MKSKWKALFALVDNQHLFATSLMAATLGKHLKMKRMKKFLKTLALVAVAAVGAVSCTDTIADDTITPSTTGGVTLYATTPSDDASTRIAFEDNDSEGITLSWEEGDTFNLYKEGDDVLVATFTCADAATGLFTSDVASLEETTYTAKYNETVDIYNQNGDEIDNLDAACQMEATFVYTADSSISITFEHTMAIMTFKFESAERPAKLVFENGEETYTVTYETIEPDNNIYTSHIMIAPCGDGETSRTMTFSLYDSDGTAYDIRSVETTKVYEAGMRYTASVSDLANTAAINFSAEISDYDSSWDLYNSNQIGIYTDQGSSEKNLKFSVATNGAMTNLSTTTLMPLDNNADRSYYAYHPYMTGGALPPDTGGFFISGTNETPSITVNRVSSNGTSYYSVPLLYATETTNATKVELTFNHVLAKVSFDLTAGGVDATDLSGAEAWIIGAYTDGTFDLKQGKFTSKDDSTNGHDTINLTINDDDTIGPLYLIPAASDLGAKLYIKVGDNTFVKTITDEWKSGYEYEYNITVGEVPTTELTLTTVSSEDIDTYSDTWEITDAAWNSNSTESSAYKAFTALRTAVKAALNANRDITLVFPNMTVFPEQSIYSVITTGTGTLSVSLPVATTIEQDAFQSSSAVVSISAPKAETISDNAFFGCQSLENFEIASTVTTIGTNPFPKCPNLHLTNSSPNFRYENGLLYSTDGSCIIAGINMDLEGDVVLGSDVTEIGYQAFYCVDNLNSITGDYVTTIGAYAFYDSGVESISFKALEQIDQEYGFTYCESLNYLELGTEASSAINIGLEYSLSDFIATDVAPNIDLVIKAEGLTYTYDEWGSYITDDMSILDNVMIAVGLSNYMGHNGVTNVLTFKSINGVGALE